MPSFAIDKISINEYVIKVVQSIKLWYAAPWSGKFCKKIY